MIEVVTLAVRIITKTSFDSSVEILDFSHRRSVGVHIDSSAQKIVCKVHLTTMSKLFYLVKS